MRLASPNLRGVWAGWGIVLAFQSLTIAQDARTLTIPAEPRRLAATPLIVDAPGNLEPGPRRLVALDGTSALDGQVFQDGGKTFLGVVLEAGPAQASRTYRIEKPASAEKGHEANLTHDGLRVSFRVDDQLVTEYVPNDGPKPYYFPLVGPSGALMTRAFPMKKVAGEKVDHPHHRSFWFTHGSVNKVDFWSEAPGHGRIVETSRHVITTGPAMVIFRTLDDWLATDGHKVCQDERTLSVYATKATRILDFDITLKATEGPVTFGDTKEGMFGLRLASTMDVTAKPAGKIINAEGLTDKATWGKASPWVDYSGLVDGKPVGVTILNHPSSFRYPTTWHVRDYGLFAANPFGWHDFGQKSSGEFVLPQGDSIRFRYRILLHEGGADLAAIPSALQDYEAPPKAVIE